MIEYLLTHWWTVPVLVCTAWAGSLAFALTCGAAIARRDRQIPSDTSLDARMQLALV